MSIRKPTKDKRPTTSGRQKEAKDPFPPLGKAQERKQVRSTRAIFGDCFVEKLTTEDWPGPVLASLNMSGKGYDGQSRDRGGQKSECRSN